MADDSSFFAVSLGGRSALTPMDAAAEYLHARTSRVLPLYLVAMTPFSLVMLIIIDVISSQNRSGLNEACLLLTLAPIWRWIGLAWIQRRVQADLRGEPPLALRQRWLSYLLTRLFANFLLLWGGFLILPAFYGLYLSGFAAPALLESDRPSYRQVRDGLTWIHQAIGRPSQPHYSPF